DRAGEQARHPAPHGLRRDVARDRTVQLEGEHRYEPTPSDTSTRGVPFARFHDSTGHRCRRATRYRATSGFTATGLPTARSRGRSEWLSAYANDWDRSAPSWAARPRSHAARASPTRGGAASLPVRRPSETASFAATIRSNKGARGR